jgi:signal transduction histidine kinase/CheY-like chemotaxis protein/HPt (histidine-containing phosphotransfer) domain-containing protein
VYVKRAIAIEAPVAIVLAIVLAILGAIGFLAYRSLSQIVGSVREESAPDLRLHSIKNLMVDLDDARNSVNAYNITSDTVYLKPYFDAISSVDGKLYELRQMPGHDSTSSAVIDSLEELIGRKFEVLDQLLVIRDDQWVDDALHRLAMSIKPETFTKVTEHTVEEPSLPTEEPKEVSSTATETIAEPQEKKKGISKVWDRIFGPKKTEEEPAVVTAPAPAPVRKEDPVERTPRVVTTTESYTVYPDISRQIASMRAREEKRLADQRGQELALADRDHRLTDSIRTLVTSFEESQRQDLAAKTAEADALASRTTRLIATFGGGAALLLVIAFWVIASGLKRSRAYNRVMAHARSRAENLARSKQEFLANMSHELRTPLHAITGFSENLLSRQLESKQRQEVETIHKAAVHLGGIINDILDLSKLDAGKLKLEHESVAIRRLLHEVGSWLRPSAEMKGIELITECDDSVPDVIRTDGMRLKQVLLNLAGNAVKFTNTGSVTTTATLVGDNLRIEVRDTGIGIPADKIESIFEGFSQAEASTTKRFGGTGLGLAITKRLVDLMGGSVSVQSTAGQGSVFTVLLPVEQGDFEIGEAPVKHRYDLSSLKVLAVDDESFNRKLLETMLTEEVKQLKVVSTGAETLESLADDKYDILLLDLRMPEMGGVEVVRALNGSTSGMKIVALTAVSETSELETARQAGIDHFLGKPFDKKSLLHKVAEVCGMAPIATNGEPPSFSLEELLEVGQGDPEFVREMVDLFIRTTADGMSDMRVAVAEGNWTQVRDIAHRLAPPCLHMKAGDLYNSLKQVEEAAPSKDVSLIRKIVAEASRQAETVLNQLAEHSRQPV